MPDNVPATKISPREQTIKLSLQEAQDEILSCTREINALHSKSNLNVRGIIKAFAKETGRTAACLKIMQEMEQEIQVLKDRLNDLENPKPVFLNKTRLPPRKDCP